METAVKAFCRTCRTECKYTLLTSVFKEGQVDGSTITLSNMLNLCTGLEVTENDPYSTLMCRQCVIQANASFSFRMKCLKTDSELKENHTRYAKEFYNTTTTAPEPNPEILYIPITANDSLMQYQNYGTTPMVPNHATSSSGNNVILIPVQINAAGEQQVVTVTNPTSTILPTIPSGQSQIVPPAPIISPIPVIVSKSPQLSQTPSAPKFQIQISEPFHVEDDKKRKILPKPTNQPAPPKPTTDQKSIPKSNVKTLKRCRENDVRSLETIVPDVKLPSKSKFSRSSSSSSASSDVDKNRNTQNSEDFEEQIDLNVIEVIQEDTNSLPPSTEVIKLQEMLPECSFKPLKKQKNTPTSYNKTASKNTARKVQSPANLTITELPRNHSHNTRNSNARKISTDAKKSTAAVEIIDLDDDDESKPDDSLNTAATDIDENNTYLNSEFVVIWRSNEENNDEAIDKQTHTPGNDVRGSRRRITFPCRKCNRQFTSQTMLTRHFLQCTNVPTEKFVKLPPLAPCQRLLKCLSCLRTFTTDKTFIEHRKEQCSIVID